MNAQTAQQQQSQPFFTILQDHEFFYLAGAGRDDLIGTYSALLRYCHAGRRHCWPSAARLARDLNRHPATVRRRLQDLAELGAIRIVHGEQGTVYHLTIPEALPATRTSATRTRTEARRERASTRAEQDQLNKIRNNTTGGPADGGRPAGWPAVVSSSKIEPEHQAAAAGGPPAAGPGGPVGCLAAGVALALVSAGAPRPDLAPRPAAGGPATAAGGTGDRPATRASIDEQTRTRLLARGASITRGVVSSILAAGPERVAAALACLEAARQVDNPTGYFMAALKQQWAPPASFVQHQQARQREAEQRRQEVAELARLLEVERTGEDLAREVEGQLEAEQERRRMFNRPALVGEDLEARRAELRARVRQQWEQEREQARRRLALNQG